MSLAESVDLVKYAFENAQTGDLFVRKAPASTIETLAFALLEMFGGSKDQIQTMGFRHGEKLYESLLSTEERVKSEDLGEYFRVPLDSRDLNYSIYFEGGQPRRSDLEAYTSHNTERLDLEGVKTLLLTIPEIRQEIGK